MSVSSSTASRSVFAAERYTIMATGIRTPGEFCWINILSPKPEEARAFFTALLGWTFGDIPGMGYSILVGGRPIGGLFDVNGPNTPPGLPPFIGVMVKVESADATCARVKELGGTAKLPFDVGEQGRMAECFDPNGAAFDIWEPKKSQGTDADSTFHGAPSWFETMTTDVGKAAPFYEALFGWKAEGAPMGTFTYTVFKMGGNMVAGMMPILPEMGPMRPHWAVYVTVNDVDATAKRAAELGGAVIMEPYDIQGVGRFCGIASPLGVTFWAITYAR